MTHRLCNGGPRAGFAELPFEILPDMANGRVGGICDSPSGANNFLSAVNGPVPNIRRKAKDLELAAQADTGLK